MTKTFGKLFLTNLAVTLIGFFILDMRVHIARAEYGVFILLGVGIALVLTVVVSKVFLRPIQQI